MSVQRGICLDCNAYCVINDTWSYSEEIKWLFTLYHCWHCDQIMVEQQTNESILVGRELRGTVEMVE